MITLTILALTLVLFALATYALVQPTLLKRKADRVEKETLEALKWEI